jgi:hypothetical protein
MESHFQKIKSDASWDEQSHLNGRWICLHLEKNLGDSRIWKISWICTASSGRQISRNMSFLRWQERFQTSPMMEKEKIMIEIITIPMEESVALAKAILAADDAEDVEEAVVAVVEEETIVSIWKMLNVSIVAKGSLSTDCSLPRKNDNEQLNMVSKSDFKNLFQSSMKEMLTKKDKQAKKNTEGDDDYLYMNVFEKLMEGKHTMIMSKSNDDLISINDTDTFDYSMQNKITHKDCENNNYNNDYDELTYPFSKRIKLKHEPEKA